MDLMSLQSVSIGKLSDLMISELMLHVYCSSNLFPSSSHPVVCPYPDVDPHINSQHYIFDNSTDTVLFDHWWNKTKTIPFYLIVLLLPLLNFRSASFFARFTFLGKTTIRLFILL